MLVRNWLSVLNFKQVGRVILFGQVDPTQRGLRTSKKQWLCVMAIAVRKLNAGKSLKNRLMLSLSVQGDGNVPLRRRNNT